jgi:hypothetical protein
MCGCLVKGQLSHNDWARLGYCFRRSRLRGQGPPVQQSGHANGRAGGFSERPLVTVAAFVGGLVLGILIGMVIMAALVASGRPR